MFGLPDSTIVKKSIPKKAIFEKFGMSSTDRARFDDNIKRINIIAEISPRTVNIMEGADVKSIFLMEVILQKQAYSEQPLLTLNRLIDQNIVFLLRFEDKCKLVVIKNSTVSNEWDSESNIMIPLNGLDLNSVLENIIISIGSIDIEDGNTLEEQIIIEKEKAALLKKIEQLRNKSFKAIQPKEKHQYFKEAQELEKVLNEKFK